MEASLAKSESKIRNLKTERIYAFDQTGKEISHSTRGTSTGTRLPKNYNYKDAILTHNHPGEGLSKNNIAGRIGRTFSGADISVAVQHNASEIRAITGTYTYSLKRPKEGWGIKTRNKALYVAQLIKTKKVSYYYEYARRARADYEAGRISKKQYDVSKERADVVGSNKALREVAKEYGWDYTRKRTS